jgi:hypothetical protein
MLTFEDVTQIENLRRKIERLQTDLTDQAKVRIFGYQMMASGQWHVLDQNLFPAMRETICKGTIAEILVLLDESAKLGVDITGPKETLATFLEDLKAGRAP